MYNGTYATSTLSSYGSYYNGRVANVLDATTTMSAGDYTYNICPKGWTLPLSSNQNVMTNYKSTFNAVTAGGYSNSSRSYAGERGFWWTRTASSSTNLYKVHSSSSSSQTDPVRWGFSVRCLQK